MENFFNTDNRFFIFLSKAWDIIILNIIYIVLCLPVFTIGPATTALYYTMVKVIRRERGYIFREFFRSFKENFKLGAISGLLLTVAYGILYLDHIYADNLGGSMSFFLKAVFNAMLFFFLALTMYIFPVLSRFTLSIKQLFQTSFFMSLKHLPFTLLIMAIFGVFVLACYLFPILLLLAPGTFYLTISYIMERILKKYMPAESEENGENVRDKWYLE